MFRYSKEREKNQQVGDVPRFVTIIGATAKFPTGNWRDIILMLHFLKMEQTSA